MYLLDKSINSTYLEQLDSKVDLIAAKDKYLQVKKIMKNNKLLDNLDDKLEVYWI